MKILIENIINAAHGVTANGLKDRNAICGQLLPSRYPIRLERHINGWEVWLRIVVDGVCVHDSDTTPSDRHAFEGLAIRANNAESERQDKHREEVTATTRLNLFGRTT
jgi:hypothetical protein